MTMINADPEDFICGGLLWSDQDTCSKVAPAIPSHISCLIVAIPPQGRNAQEICSIVFIMEELTRKHRNIDHHRHKSHSKQIVIVSLGENETFNGKCTSTHPTQ